MRSRLFEYWFSTYNRKALFTMISSSIVDAEGVVNFATIILRNDNPELSEIIVEFTESIALASNVDTIASGGVKDINDIINCKNNGNIAGVIVGKAFYEGTLDLEEAFNILKK